MEYEKCAGNQASEEEYIHSYFRKLRMLAFQDIVKYTEGRSLSNKKVPMSLDHLTLARKGGCAKLARVFNHPLFPLSIMVVLLLLAWLGGNQSSIHVPPNTVAKGWVGPEVFLDSLTKDIQQLTLHHWYRNEERARLHPLQIDITKIHPEGIPPVAENGSYYGELNEEGRPKTVYVKGYYRKNGTYVRSYFRASTRQEAPYGFKIDDPARLSWHYDGDQLNKATWLETMIRESSLKIRVFPIEEVEGL